MKTKIKRHYRSAISVLLSVCMLVSCVAVGLIGTDAAKVDNYNPVGVNWANYCMIGDAMGWSERTNDYHSMGSTVTYDCSAYIGQDMFFRVYCDGNQKGVNGSPSVSINQWYALTTTDGFNNSAHRTVTKGLLTFKVTNEGSDDGQIYVTADEDPVYKLYQSDGTAIATFTHPDSSKTFTATTGTLTAGTTYQLYLGNSYTTYKCSTSGTLTTGSNVTLEKDKSNMISFTPSVTAPYIFTWEMDANRGTYSGTLSVEARTATITTAASPSGAGTVKVSTSQSGAYESSVTVPAEATVYLKAENTNNKYEFSEWRAVSGLTFDNRTGATTSATATATATATAVFLPINYNLTRENPAHAKIKIPNQARWGETVTPTATTDVGFKISKYKYSTDGGSTWTDVTPGSGFTMPEHNVVVSAEVTECTAYTVTMTPSGSGTISAKTAEGQTISTGDRVNEGTVITFTAVPADQAYFTNWGGDLSGSVSPTTLTVNADKTVTATFVDNAYFVASYTSSSYSADSSDYSSIAMTRLNNGYYRSSTTIPLNRYFTVGKTAGSTTTYAKCGPNEPWRITTDVPAVIPQHWTSDAKMQSKYQNKIGASYVFFDPETDKIWLSSDPAGFTGVTIFAKDGSLVAPKPGTGTTPGTTCGWGDTTLTVTASGGNKQVTNVFNDQVHKASLTAAEVQASTTSVTVSTTSSKSGYYVYGFDVNGITIQADENGSATFCPADLDCNISNYIEITPIYMLTDPSLTNPNAKPTTIRFYVRSFAGEIESRWGGELYCYAYENESIRTNGNWPGQPMINLGGGTYYMDLPINTKGITLSNAAADWVHATTMGIGLPTSGNTWEQTSWDNRNAYQCQSYDYDDFQYIYAKPGVGENDEDIIFDFKYKQGEWGKSGLDNFPDNQFEKSGYSETNFPNNLDPSNSSYQWEEYTDFYGNPVDLWGTRLTSNYNNNPVRIVVQGYYDTTAANSSYYATTYVVYKPSTTTEANPTYSIVKYTSNNMSDYGKLSRSEFLQRSAEDMGLTELAGQPVEITYEYAIYKNMSTKGSHPENQLNQYAERADGVWYYSETKPVKAKIKIQYADKLYGAYTDDTFEIDTDTPGTDYDGDPYTVNEGTVTKGKAYFIDNNISNANRPTGAPFDVPYTNRTVEFAYSDGNEHYELQAEESPDGEYTFVGWYKETSNGLDKCPPGFTYSMEATTNETFIARYVKAPSGIKLAHKPVVNGKGGNGNRNVKYEIYNNANLTGNPLKTGEANGSIVVDKKYIKHNQNYYLKVTYEVVPDGNSLPNGIYSTGTQAPEFLISEEGFESHNTYNSKHVDVDNFALTPEGTATTNTTKVEFKVPINAFFKQITGTNDYEFDEDLALLELFSDIDRKRNNINITKTVDYNNGETFSFTVKAFNDHGTPDDFTDDRWDDYAGKYTVGDDPTEHSFTGTISNVSGGQTIHIVGAPAGTVFQISEVDLATDTAYNFYSVTIDGATATDDIPKGKQFTMPNNGSVDMEFTNNIKYQFEITYIYESYSAKTYKDNTAHDDDNRVEGANRSYTQTGEISREDLDTYFNKASDGSLSIKSDKRKDFINKFAPYEDDFMLNLVWDDSNPKATYDAPNKTIRLETTATSVTARTVRVKVKMPWSDGAYVAVPESKLYTTQYGDHVYDTDGSFLTAPQTLDNNGTTMYFKYWQIKTDYNEKDTNYSDTNSKRCYYDSFNMTMYQDSYVEAVYDTTETSFNPSAQSYADTENGEARIAFMETSRNQWNNNGDPVTNKLAGDRIYTDFQLTFGYKDILLNTAVESGIKTGFVMEQVALLDEEGGKFVTKTESEYKTRYDGDTAQKTTRENAVKAYIADKSKSTYTDALGAHTFKLNSNIALATLDNKNQCKHSVDMSNKVLRGDNLEEGTLKNYVYRAYTYIQLSDGSIVLSDPVYFTIYDVATINNGTTN